MKLPDDSNTSLSDTSCELNSSVEFDVPKLSIIELMVLTAAMAFAFAFHERLMNSNAVMKTNVLWFDTLRRAVMALRVGLPFAAIYRFAMQKKATGRFLLQPGHWVLFGTLIFSLGFVPWSFLTELQDGPNGWYYWTFAVCSLVSGAVIFYGSICVGRRWFATLVFMGLQQLATAAFLGYLGWVFSVEPIFMSSMFWYEAYGWATYVLNILTSVALIIVLLLEFRSRKGGDLWHWLGILIVFLTCVVEPFQNYLLEEYFANQ